MPWTRCKNVDLPHMQALTSYNIRYVNIIVIPGMHVCMNALIRFYLNPHTTNGCILYPFVVFIASQSVVVILLHWYEAFYSYQLNNTAAEIKSFVEIKSS